VSEETRNRYFDELASGLASGSISRGRALRLMGAALVGGVLGSLGGVAAAAPHCRPIGKRCKSGSKCCSGICDPAGGTCCSGSACFTTDDCCGALICVSDPEDPLSRHCAE
jgi:hypothetical protein